MINQLYLITSFQDGLYRVINMWSYILWISSEKRLTERELFFLQGIRRIVFIDSEEWKSVLEKWNRLKYKK